MDNNLADHLSTYKGEALGNSHENVPFVADIKTGKKTVSSEKKNNAIESQGPYSDQSMSETLS